MQKAIGCYANGNAIAMICEDGTKVRWTPNNEPPALAFPESIDVKITNVCDLMCPNCHEMSSPYGAHANLSHPLLESLPAYTELAIGGGDPLKHPVLQPFLRRMKEKNVICNLTVHWKSFVENYLLLNWLKDTGLIHGLGVSVNEMIPERVAADMASFDNLVVHSICGIATMDVLGQFAYQDMNLLLLGYKRYGRGVKYHTDHEDELVKNIVELQDGLVDLFESFKAVSFDNRALIQLDVKSKLSVDQWNRFFMGEDGECTMYVDLVANQYAISSTSERHDIDSNDIKELFAKVKQEKKENEKL